MGYGMQGAPQLQTFSIPLIADWDAFGILGTTYGDLTDSGIKIPFEDVNADGRFNKARIEWMGRTTSGVGYLRLYDGITAAAVPGTESSVASTTYVGFGSPVFDVDNYATSRVWRVQVKGSASNVTCYCKKAVLVMWHE